MIRKELIKLGWLLQLQDQMSSQWSGMDRRRKPKISLNYALPTLRLWQFWLMADQSLAQDKPRTGSHIDDVTTGSMSDEERW